MDFLQTSLAFKGCNGEANSSLKKKIISLNITKEELLAGYLVSNLNNFILTDIHKLLNKSVLNLYAADLNISNGFFNWGFVTSYYSNFFAVQALNRLALNFSIWLDSRVNCELNNAFLKEFILKNTSSSNNTHENEFSTFFTNYNSFKTSKSVNRYWTLGIRQFSMGKETSLRNEINYSVSNDYYYELNIDYRKFEKIKLDNVKDPKTNLPKITDPLNYSNKNIELAIARISMIIYILNYIANKNIEYKSYFLKLITEIKVESNKKYPFVNQWIKDNIDAILVFENIEEDEIVNSLN